VRISVVIPVYNSEDILRSLVERLSPVLAKVADRYQLIFVNDGSQDGSWEVLVELATQHDWIHAIDLMRNAGQHNALLCGIRAAQYEVTVTVDDDLQHPPEEIPTLLAEFAEGYDVVYGTPRKEQHGLLRDLASVVTKMVLKSAMGVHVARNVSPFRVFHTHLREAFADYTGPFVSIDVLLTWGGSRFAAVPVRHAPRMVGVSNYTLRKLLAHTFNMLTGFSTAPLQFASLLGFALTAFGFLVLVYVVGRYLISGVVVPGFAFLGSIIAIFSGAQLFTLGVIGEYLTRMHFRLMDRPAYVVASETNAELSPHLEGGTTTQ
jgi:glycosyltransferase involved in cell wall biosynthesis